jgi:hypothetical protein
LSHRGGHNLLRTRAPSPRGRSPSTKSF